MKVKLFSIILILFIFYGCSFLKTEWRIDELYIQKIEGSSKVIYNFSAWGGLDSNPRGFIVLDSTETFQVDVEKILPIYQLSDIPNKSYFEGITHDCYGTCGETYYDSAPIFKPMKLEKMKIEDIEFTNRIYQYKGYSEHDRGLENYVFEKFKETKDSLYFYNLDDVESMDGQHLNELKVRKGEIYIQLAKNKDIKKIIADDVRLNSETKAVEQIRHIVLTPKSKIKNDKLSERGIFREVKISN
ncbi:hypothetical protein [Chryseobacterium taiwanense]|uniref:Lipoprotein n=1 Tax=Chryseobacterium taiwanense TaxID=363331 RepID=A0A0B4D5L7_9FLAO|nr:hypothetical protein [Chryseobacterium taiwanense]KIC61986.1 hypothetical protein RM51_13910 [Chryseobacterium taiwanense]